MCGHKRAGAQIDGLVYVLYGVGDCGCGGEIEEELYRLQRTAWTGI